MKIIVTGGAGFIGSALIKYLIETTDYKVINIDKLTYAGNLNSLESVSKNKNYDFKRTDICDQKNINKIINDFKPDKIINLAAESHVDRSIDGPADFITTNILGTYNLLEESRNYWNKLDSKDKKDNFRFYHISTDEVYGDISHTKNKANEKNQYDPSSPYSASKAAADHLVRAWYKTFQVPTIISNCSNNYGPFNFLKSLFH